MYAIVLTCDRYRALTEHMVFKYQQLWPDHPFRFRIPCQHPPTTPAFSAMVYCPAPVAIKATVLTLLADLDDEEWIYWCIDDKYPIDFDLPKVKAITHWVIHGAPPAVSGILYCRCRRLLEPVCLTGATLTDSSGQVYLERKAYPQIWIHQFLRVKVIRYLFEQFPDVISPAGAMDDLKDQIAKPAAHRLYVTQDNRAIFGESTGRGVLTQNCWESMTEIGLKLPDGWDGQHCGTFIMGEPTWKIQNG